VRLSCRQLITGSREGSALYLAGDQSAIMLYRRGLRPRGGQRRVSVTP